MADSRAAECLAAASGVAVDYPPDCGIAVVNPAVILVDERKAKVFLVLDGEQTAVNSNLNGMTVSG